MTDTEKAALYARIDELCQENERLRKAKDTMRGDAFEIGAMLVKARDENVKLRELAQRLLTEYRYIRVRPRRMYLEHEARMRAIEDEMQALGIEVSS